MIKLKKPEYLKKLVVGVIIILVFTNILTFVSYKNIEGLVANSETLSLDFDTLKTKYNELKSDFTLLISNYSNMTNEYEQLHARFTSLEMNYSFLQSIYNETINLPEFRFGEGGDCTLFVTPSNEKIKEITYSVLGENSDGHLSIQDIENINTWVADNIYYVKDLPYGGRNHSFQYPKETFVKGYGDCEDHATLMLSMCKAEENVPWLWCASIFYYKNDRYAYHVCVFAKVSDDEYYVFDPTLNSGWKSNSSELMYYALEENYADYLGVNYVHVSYIFNENTYRRFEDIIEFFEYF